MQKIHLQSKQILAGMPLAAILGASLFPLQTWAQQALVLFTLLWFNVFLLFDVLGK